MEYKVDCDMSEAPQVFWCPVCKQMGINTKLGIFENDVVRIKRKDLYVEFQGTGAIRITCWKCGAQIEQLTSDYTAYLKFLAKK